MSAQEALFAYRYKSRTNYERHGWIFQKHTWDDGASCLDHQSLVIISEILLEFVLYFYMYRHMDIQKALIVFDALSQETRLLVFRMLIEYGTQGAPAGALSDRLDIPHNSLSFHLKHMSNAGLVLSRREGRSIIYSANFELFTGLIRYMIEDCCRVEFASIREDRKRGSSVIELMNCCQPKKEKRP